VRIASQAPRIRGGEQRGWRLSHSLAGSIVDRPSRPAALASVRRLSGGGRSGPEVI
jgi:hypothetical protein